MKNIKKLKAEQSGIAHLGLIVVVLLVFGVVGFGAYRAANNKKSDSQSTSVSTNTEEQGDFDEDTSSSDDLNSFNGLTEENDE